MSSASGLAGPAAPDFPVDLSRSRPVDRPSGMPTLLRIDSSLRTEGSHGRALADHAEDLWLRAHGGRVLRRDLARDPVPHLDAAAWDALGRPGTLSGELIDELEQAGDVLVSSALYNLGVPSTLKAWIDHVTCEGRTFRATEAGLTGLLRKKRALVVGVRGGTREGDAGARNDFQGDFLASIFSFLGFERTDVVEVEGMMAPDRERRLAEARDEITRLFAAHAEEPGPRWLGAFGDEDRRQIEALRREQEQQQRGSG